MRAHARKTRLEVLNRATQTSIVQKIFVKLLRIFGKILQAFVIFEFFSLIFAQILMKFCRNFADKLENVEIFFPQTPKSTAKTRASSVANCAAGGTVPRKYKKLVSENVHATRVYFTKNGLR